MTIKTRAYVAAVTLSILTSLFSGPSHGISTNPLQEPAGGTVPMIKVTASAEEVVCASVNCPPIAVAVDLDSNDNNSGLPPGIGAPPSSLNGRTVYLWWLGGAAPSTRQDCGRIGAAPVRGVLLGTTAFGSTGTVSMTVNIPPAGAWIYGPNWLCATDVQPGGAGGFGDLMFTVKPAP